MSEPTAATAWPVETPLRVGILLFEGVEPLDAIGPAQVLWSLGTARASSPPSRPSRCTSSPRPTCPCGPGTA